MSLPHATQDQINSMNRVAEEKMKKDGIIPEQPLVQLLDNKHPLLQHHEEPSEEISYEEPEVQEYFEEEVISTTPQESSQQMNFRMIRERAERAERERDEAMKYAMSFNQPKQPVIKQEIEDDYSDIGLDDDGLAEGKHLKKVMKEMRELKKEMQAYKSQTTNDTVEVKLRSQYPDLDKVITQENLHTLSSMNPDLADMISQTPDLYKRAKLAYDMVKKFGIYQDKSYDNDKELAQKNASKPKPLASVSPQQGDSPLSKANAFANGSMSKELKDQMHREMVAAMRGR